MHDSNSLMSLAFEAAIAAIPLSAPNPAVGAVIYNFNTRQIVATGFTQAIGNNHAEIEAIESALKKKIDLRQCTLYVTLEPCCHFGRTGPCTDVIISQNIAKVVVANRDPTENINGRGLRLLQQAGIEVEYLTSKNFSLETELTLGPFFKFQKQKKPYVILKWAQDKNGSLAPASGSSGAVSGTTAKQFVHRLRRLYKNTLVTAGTIVADKPLLNDRVMGADGITMINNRFLKKLSQFSTQMNNTETKRIFWLPRLADNWQKTKLQDFLKTQSALSGHCIFISPEAEVLKILLETGHAQQNVLSAEKGMEHILEQLYKKGIYTLMVEAGPNMAEKWRYYADLLIVFQSELAIFNDGRSFSLSKQIADDNLPKDFHLLQRSKIAEDQLSFFKQQA